MFEDIISIISANYEIQVDSIRPESNLKDDLELDSLDMTELIYDLEKHFGINIDEARPFETVQDIVITVEKLTHV